MHASSPSLSLNERLPSFLLTYRTTPHATTRESPSMLLHGLPLHTRLDLLPPDTARWVEEKRTANPLTQARQLEICANVLASDYRLATTYGYPVPSRRDRSLDSTTKHGLHQESCGIKTLTSSNVHQLLPCCSNRLQSLSWCLHRRKNVETPKQKSKQLVISSAHNRKCTDSIGSTADPASPAPVVIMPAHVHPHLLQSVVIHSVNEELAPNCMNYWHLLASFCPCFLPFVFTCALALEGRKCDICWFHRHVLVSMF